jgi:hypothetical protein
MAKRTDADQVVAVEEPTKKPEAPKPVQLRSARDYTIATTALTTRAADLKKLAEKTRTEGYPREASSIDSDALAIEQFILPQFRAQQELPLITVEQLEKAIEEALRIPIVNAFNGLGDPKTLPTPDNIAGRKEMLSKRLVTRLSLYARAVAKEAFDAGVAAREALPETLALRSIAELRTSNGNGA